jgi:hypothetical protein
VAINTKIQYLFRNKYFLTGKKGTFGLCIPSLTFIGIGGGPFGFGFC